MPAVHLSVGLEALSAWRMGISNPPQFFISLGHLIFHNKLQNAPKMLPKRAFKMPRNEVIHISAWAVEDSGINHFNPKTCLRSMLLASTALTICHWACEEDSNVTVIHTDFFKPLNSPKTQSLSEDVRVYLGRK